MGTTSTRAAPGGRSEGNPARQPGGSGVAAAAGKGPGTMGRTARTAQDRTIAAGRQPDASRGRRRAANAAKAGTAAAAAEARATAAPPSATVGNPAGRGAPSP